MPHANNRGVRIYYEVEGEGPPVLLLHGTTGSLEDWREAGYTGALRDRQLVLVDLRGHGRSDKPHEPSAYDWPDLVNDANCVLDELAISRADVFGYSAGSYIAIAMAMIAPQHVRSLIVGGASNKWAGLSDRGRQLLSQGIEAFVDATFESTGPLPADLRQRLLANDPTALIASLSANRCTPSREELEAFDKPAFVYVGDADPRLADSREMSSQLPNATLVTLPGLNHLQAFWQSDLVLPRLSKFLASLRS